MLLILVGVAFIAESGVILKWVPRSDPFATNAVAMLVGAVILVVISTISGEVWSLPAQRVTWASVAYLVVFGSIAMLGLYLFALRRWAASAVSYATLLMPLVTVPIAAALIAEQVSLWFLWAVPSRWRGVYVGAFLKIRPRRSSATSAPECLPIDACAESEGRCRARDQDRFLTAGCPRMAPSWRRCVGDRHGPPSLGCSLRYL